MPSTHVAQALDLPLKQRAKVLLDVPEDQWFDRKSDRTSARDLADTLIGFANADGGTVVIGLHKGAVEGISGRSERINAWRQAAVDFAHPPVRAYVRQVACQNDEGEEDELLVIDVESSDVVHANPKDEVFLRVGDETRKLTFRQRQELLYDKGQSAFEATVVQGASVEELDRDLLGSYAESLRHPHPERLLIARGLATRDGELTAAGYLLFGREPQARFPEAYVRVLRYRGSARGTGSRQQLVHEARCEGPIPMQLMTAREQISAFQPSRRALGSEGRFEQVGLIPTDAWLEGVVNAVVHRSYSMVGDHIRVEIFDDRMEIESPGRFPGLVSLQEPQDAVRFARNPRIARVCADLNFGQELGEGIRRMFEEMRLAGLSDPLYVQTAGSVRVVLSTLPTDRELEDRLPARSRELVRALRQAGRLSTGDAADLVQMSRPATLKRLRSLEKEGVVRWVGNSPKDPRAYWELVDHIGLDDGPAHERAE